MTIPLNDESSQSAAIEQTKSAITSMLMYSHMSFMDAGFPSEEAKKKVVQMIESIHETFAEAADLDVRSLAGPLQRLDKAVLAAKEQAKQYPSVRNLYQDLLTVQAQLNKKR